jgi:transglutaminase-like putative cysteine protease
MMWNARSLIIVLLLVVAVLLSGCEGFLPESSTIFEAQPTSIQYDISYGYTVNSTGTGRYDVIYLCPVPEVPHVSITYNALSPLEYQMTTRANNTFISWNITRDDTDTFELGLTAHVVTRSVLVTDLSGAGAVELGTLPGLYPAIVHQYTHVQANETTAFIDPENVQIQTIARGIQSNEQTNNTFLLAKALFTWLKTNLRYQVHPENQSAQPAIMTLQKKSGDCDDLSFLYISLCRSLGIPARFVRGYLLTMASNGTAIAVAHAWSEVYVAGSLGNNGWIPVECSCCVNSVEVDVEQNFGVEDVLHLRLFTDDGSNESLILSSSGITLVSHGLLRHLQTSAFATIRNLQVLMSQKLVVDQDQTRHYASVE